MTKKPRKKNYAELEAAFRKQYGHIFKGVTTPRPEPFAPPKDLPWQNSYANWCAHLGPAAAKHNAKIRYGDDTYRAWQAGVAPLDYAKMHGTR